MKVCFPCQFCRMLYHHILLLATYLNSLFEKLSTSDVFFLDPAFFIEPFLCLSKGKLKKAKKKSLHYLSYPVWSPDFIYCGLEQRNPKTQWAAKKFEYIAFCNYSLVESLLSILLTRKCLKL